MLITKECDYAVRILRALTDKSMLNVKDICAEEEITVPFAYKILNKLRMAELVDAYRGSNGGYAATEKAKKSTLLDVYQAIDPNFSVGSKFNMSKTKASYPGASTDGNIREEIETSQQNFFKVLQRKTLQEVFRGR
ncbi:MAG: RrF2 family transcriptional regulator [Lachnospiraceae bacterium]